MSSYVCSSDEVSNLSIWVQMIQLMWNYFKCIPHLLLLENDLMLSDFMTRVFKNCSFTTSTKPNCYFWPCSIFCPVLVVIVTLDLMNECADVSVNPCAWNVHEWMNLFIYLFLAPNGTLDPVCLLFLANLLCPVVWTGWFRFLFHFLSHFFNIYTL